MGGDVVVLAEIGLDRREQVLLGGFRLLERLAGEGVLVEQDLPTRNLVDPLLVDLQLAQRFGDFNRVAPGAKVRRRALQHGDVRRILGHRRDQRRGGGARADHDHALVLVVEIFRPFLRMDDRALELGHVLPLRRIAFGVAVIALAHPEEIGGEAKFFAGVGARGLDGPAVFRARPCRRGDGVLVADVAAEIVFLDHFAHVFQDLGGARDRRAGPRLEAVAEGVQVAVGSDSGIAMRAPGAAEGLLGFQRDEARSRALLGEMIGRTDAGDAGPRDQDVEMLGGAGQGFVDLGLNVHLPCSFVCRV